MEKELTPGKLYAFLMPYGPARIYATTLLSDETVNGQLTENGGLVVYLGKEIVSDHEVIPNPWFYHKILTENGVVGYVQDNLIKFMEPHNARRSTL